MIGKLGAVSKGQISEIKLSLSQAMEAHRVARD
jgi:hypothetical protein